LRDACYHEGVVKFQGSFPDIESVYAATDFLCFPSHEEPLGSALLRPWRTDFSRGSPRAAGVPEVVEDGRNGLLVKELDPVLWQPVIARLLSEPTKRGGFGEAARETNLVALFRGSDGGCEPSTFTNAHRRSMKSRALRSQGLQKCNEPNGPFPRAPGSLGNNYYASFLPSRVPPICSGFPEIAGVLTYPRPDGSRNSSPMTKPSLCGWQ